MPSSLTRIISDVHFGDQASRVKKLAQLRPLFEGVDHLVLNGDTLDTRPGPFPAHTAGCKAAVAAFFPHEIPGVTYLSGNHDSDTAKHHLDLADGKVFVTHGDIFFDDIVPWSNDATFVRQRMTEELGEIPSKLHHDFATRSALIRRVTAAIPQRHQGERRKLKYLVQYLADTVWPPARIWRIVRAWQLAPVRAAHLSRVYRPAARFVVSGHTHRPGVWRMPNGVTVLNTGSYCPPMGGFAVDVTAHDLRVHRVVNRNHEFRLGPAVAEFALAAGDRLASPSP